MKRAVLLLILPLSACVGPLSKESRDYRAYMKGYMEMNKFVSDNRHRDNLGFRSCDHKGPEAEPRIKGAAAMLWYYLRDNPKAREIWDDDVQSSKDFKEKGQASFRCTPSEK